MSIESKIFRPIIEFISINDMDFNGSTMVESYLTAMTLATMPDVDSDFVDEYSRKHAKILSIKINAYHMIPMARKYKEEVFIKNVKLFYDYITTVLIADVGNETKPLFHALRKIRNSMEEE